MKIRTITFRFGKLLYGYHLHLWSYYKPIKDLVEKKKQQVNITRLRLVVIFLLFSTRSLTLTYTEKTSENNIT